MDNYIYFLREIIEKNTIYYLDKYSSSRADIDRFLEEFSKEIEAKYIRKVYKTLRYLVIDQIYYVLREEETPKNVDQAAFTIALHDYSYYFMMEKVLPIDQANLLKSNINLINTKNSHEIKDLYLEALKDLDTDLDFTFIDIKKRVQGDIYSKLQNIDSNYAKIWIISIYNLAE